MKATSLKSTDGRAFCDGFEVGSTKAYANELDAGERFVIRDLRGVHRWGFVGFSRNRGEKDRRRRLCRKPAGLVCGASLSRAIKSLSRYPRSLILTVCRKSAPLAAAIYSSEGHRLNVEKSF